MKWLLYISGAMLVTFLALASGYGEMPMQDGAGVTFAVQ